MEEGRGVRNGRREEVREEVDVRYLGGAGREGRWENRKRGVTGGEKRERCQ